MLCIRHTFRTVHIPSSSEKVSVSAIFHHCLKSLKLSPSCASVSTGPESTVNEEEIKKFQEMAQKWWDPSGFGSLFAMNAVRVPFIQNGILQAYPKHEIETKPLVGFTILDVGCGAGIVAESLARLGAHVTGLDPGEENIKVAQYHSSLDAEVKDNLEYICSTIEDHCKENKKYSAVVCSEVIEHVDNVPLFVKCCTDLVENGGSVFFTTINRTIFSYVYAIFLAERVFHFIPQGVHEWNKFIKPEDLKFMLESHDCKTISIRGTFFNPFSKKFSYVQYKGAFYCLHAVKGIPGSTNA